MEIARMFGVRYQSVQWHLRKLQPTGVRELAHGLDLAASEIRKGTKPEVIWPGLVALFGKDAGKR